MKAIIFQKSLSTQLPRGNKINTTKITLNAANDTENHLLRTNNCWFHTLIGNMQHTNERATG